MKISDNGPCRTRKAITFERKDGLSRGRRRGQSPGGPATPWTRAWEPLCHHEQATPLSGLSFRLCPAQGLESTPPDSL